MKFTFYKESRPDTIRSYTVMDKQLITYSFVPSAPEFFSLQHIIGKVITNKQVPDYSTMTQEELFQASTVYNFIVPMDILIKLQVYIKTLDINSLYSYSREIN